MPGAAAERPAFRLLFCLDITGSMGCQLDGCKEAISQLVKLSEDLQVPLTYVISTFTEAEKERACCTSLAEFATAAEAEAYVRAISLCQPPEQPGLNAGGDDGPENHKAALVRLTDLEVGPPTIGFMITDALPHLQSQHRTNTHRAELAWLEARGLPASVANDFFQVLAHVVDHFGPSLVLSGVLYSSAPEALSMYGQMAQATGGMLLRPSSNLSQLLARGLLDVVKALVSRLDPSAPAFEANSLEGFELWDTRELQPRASEEAPAVGVVKSGDSEALFAIAMDRMCAVCGTKWSKRAVGMSAPAEQLQFVWRLARLLAGTGGAAAAEAELVALRALRSAVLEELPADSRGHFSVTEADLEAWAAEAAGAGGTANGTGAAANAGVEGSVAARSCISFETVGEALEEDADWEDWLATVMRLLQGFPLRLQLPLDKDGNPDFMDAWSAVAENIGVDRLSAAEFMALVGPSSHARGPTDAAAHNAFLVAVEPGDRLAGLVFRAASGTQVLNYVTGVLMGARGFLPHLHAGTAASCLLGLLGSEKPRSEFRWAQAQAIAHTLRLSHRPAAAGVARELLQAGRANPADAIPKLLAALLGLRAVAAGVAAAKGAGTKRPAPEAQLLAAAVPLVLEEWAATMVQKHYGKRTPESDAEYLASIQDYTPWWLLVPGTGAAADPLRELHPLERKGAELQAAPGWKAVALRRLRGEGAAPHPVLARFVRSAGALLALLAPQMELPGAGAAAAGVMAGEAAAAEALLAAAWPGWESAFLSVLLLRQRTARYSSTTTAGAEESEGTGAAAAAMAPAPAGVVTWERVEVESPAALALARAREALTEELAGYRRARAAEAEARLLDTAAAALRAVAAAGADEAGLAAALAPLFLPLGPTPAAERPAAAPRGPVATLLDQTLCLSRSHVAPLLERLMGAPEGAERASGGEPEVPLPLLRALVLGDWTPGPPQMLRKSLLVRRLCMAAGEGGADMLDAIAARELAMREGKPNRHGHSLALQYPGPAGWSHEYAAARLAAAPCWKRYVKAMRRFTKAAAWARGVAAAQGGARPAELEALLASYDDANLLPAALGRAEALLGEKMPAPLAEKDAGKGSSDEEDGEE